MSAATSRSEVSPALRSDPSPAALQRGDGAAEIAFARRGATTHVARLYQRSPCRVAFPRPDPGDPALAVLLTTSGGLAGGDRIALSVTAEPGAAATVATAAAEKIYRSLGADCTVAVKLEAGAGAWLEWLPQETILFDRARLRRRVGAEVAPSGRLLAAEMFVFGRVARGELFREGLLFESWRVRRGETLVWADALRLDGDIAAALARPASFGGADALTTIVYAGADAERHLALARDLAEAAPCRAGATLVNGILLARALGGAGEVRATLANIVGGLRHASAGLPPSLPRVWKI